MAKQFFLWRWFSGFLKWFGIIADKGKDILEDLMPKVIELVNNIKEFDTAIPEIGDFMTKIIPGDWDDKLKEKAREVIPSLLVAFKAGQSCLEKDTNDEVLICITNVLQSETNINVKILQWGDLAALITHSLSDKELSIEELRTMVKYVYDNMGNED